MTTGTVEKHGRLKVLDGEVERVEGSQPFLLGSLHKRLSLANALPISSSTHVSEASGCYHRLDSPIGSESAVRNEGAGAADMHAMGAGRPTSPSPPRAALLFVWAQTRALLDFRRIFKPLALFVHHG